MLVLTAGHQQIHPADGGALDRDDHIARTEAARIRRRHLDQRGVVLDRIERLLAELGDDNAMAGGELVHATSVPLPRYRARVPVYDQVLGSYLDLEGVAVGMRAAAQQIYAEAISNDDDLSAQDRMDRVEKLAEVPGLKLALACEGEELDRYLVIANAGEVRVVGLVDSRVPDHVEEPTSAIQPQVAVAGDLDAVIARLQKGGALDPIYDLGNGAIQLPYRWHTRDGLLRALADLGSQLAAPPFRVEVDERRFELFTEGRRLRCEPLFLVAPDDGPGFGAAFFEVAHLAPPSPADQIEVELRARPMATLGTPPMRDPSRPFTTGTVDQRRASIAAATAAKTRDFARLIAALQDPANSEPRFDQVRRDLYRYLATHDTREIAGLFLWALQEESESAIETVTYLAWRQSALLAALPDLAEAADARGDRRTAVRMRAALDEAHG